MTRSSTKAPSVSASNLLPRDAPECETLAEPGPCPKCGAEVPVCDEVAEIAAARQKALAPYLEQAGQLRSRFEQIPKGKIPLTSDQFVTCMQDTEVMLFASKAVSCFERIAALDMNDRQKVGSQVRRAVAESIEEIAELADVAAELARFAPQGPAAELRSHGIFAGQVGVTVVATLIETITAGTIAEARGANREMQAALDSYSAPADELFERLHHYHQPDIDARVSQVLQKPGNYSDELGFVEIGKVFGAFAGEGSLFGALADRARTYFAHLIPTADLPEGGAVVLILPAVMLASLNRPLLGHRAATGMVELVSEAIEADRKAVAEVARRGTGEGPRIFAAASRVYKGMRQMLRADQVEAIDEELALREALSAYQELSESSYKSYGRMLLELEAIAAGEPLAERDRQPTLTPLKERLEASDRDLLRETGAAIDTALRNAIAHAEYGWDPEAEEVENYETGKRWTPEELELGVERLVSTVVGLDAGFCAKLVVEDLGLTQPEWLGSAKAPTLTTTLVETMFAASGFEEIAVADRGATVTISAAEPSDLTPLMTAMGGVSVIAPDAESYQVIDGSTNATLIDVPGSVMRTARDAPAESKDLALLRAFFESALRTGSERADATRESLALQTKIVSVTAMLDVVENGMRPEAFTRMRSRFEGVREFALEQETPAENELNKLVPRLERVISLTYPAAREEAKAAAKLARQLSPLVDWAERQGVVWPPAAPGRQ